MVEKHSSCFKCSQRECGLSAPISTGDLLVGKLSDQTDYVGCFGYCCHGVTGGIRAARRAHRLAVENGGQGLFGFGTDDHKPKVVVPGVLAGRFVVVGNGYEDRGFADGDVVVTRYTPGEEVSEIEFVRLLNLFDKRTYGGE